MVGCHLEHSLPFRQVLGFFEVRAYYHRFLLGFLVGYKEFVIGYLTELHQYQKPVLLHIRKAHAETIAILKAQKFKLGGIAHAFSGGVEEAKALVKLGFKIGVTGQITNPNAKKLHQVVVFAVLQRT